MTPHTSTPALDCDNCHELMAKAREAGAKAERERVLDAVLCDLAGRSCIGLALEKIERERGKGWLRGELLKSLRRGDP